MKIKQLFLAFLIISISSKAQSTSTRTTIENPEKDGMIVGTIAISNSDNKNYKKLFSLKKANLPFEKSRRENRKAIDSIRKSENLSDYYDNVKIERNNCDFSDTDKCVYFFIIVKPKGEYLFYTLQIISPLRGYINPIKIIPLDITFEIEPGKIKYLGEINYDEKNGTIEVLNKAERDRIKFTEKYPAIKF